MCGICGVVAASGTEIGLSDLACDAMRDRLAHRGPDGAGRFRDGEGSVYLGHRRLSIIDPTPAGDQPMLTPDGRFVLVYNGELYNDGEVRAALADEGVAFASACDTETVLHALAHWGSRACARFRGMYALACWDTLERTLLLARDGFGMKPLYYAFGDSRLVFASEIPALLAHPMVRAEPDLVTVSAYISTIRTTLDDRTMYEGVRTLRPGEWIRFDCSSSTVWMEREFPPQPGFEPVNDSSPSALAESVRDALRVHLRSDVPWCSLLSGGLDSTILAMTAASESDSLRTYVSGCPDAGGGLSDDFEFARRAADAIGTIHSEVPVDRETFLNRWPAMVRSLGVPMSTPNEVAINAVARQLRADGHAVTLSGEGADELFAGYELPLLSAENHVRNNPDTNLRRDAEAGLESAAWLGQEPKWLFLSDGLREASDRDAHLMRWTEDLHASSFREAIAAGEEGDTARVRAFLGMQRRVNLVGLLQRLDTATMLESVEGRTPFADTRMLAASFAIRWRDLFVGGNPPGTKLALRDAFRDALPLPIIERPKRSFPLPFQPWIAGVTGDLLRSPFLCTLYKPEAIEFVRAAPEQHWNLAWPMANLALWGERFV